jgi:hypothetical protein
MLGKQRMFFRNVQILDFEDAFYSLVTQYGFLLFLIHQTTVFYSGLLLFSRLSSYLW